MFVKLINTPFYAKVIFVHYLKNTLRTFVTIF